MAQYRNPRTGDVITVFDQVADMYARKPDWELLTPLEPAPAEPPADEPVEKKTRKTKTSPTEPDPVEPPADEPVTTEPQES